MDSETTNPPGLAMVIMGVAGSGKSTVGDFLAKSLSCPFLDADDFHSAENKEKMRRGIPLTDSDRIPWLEMVRDALIDYILRGKMVVLACSALQPSYRSILRTADYEYMLEIHGKDKPELDLGEDSQIWQKHGQWLGPASPPSSHRVKFFLLNGSMDLFASRLELRLKEGAHFMPPALLQSQIDSLKITENEGIIFLDASMSPEAIVDHIKEAICHNVHDA